MSTFIHQNQQELWHQVKNCEDNRGQWGDGMSVITPTCLGQTWEEQLTLNLEKKQPRHLTESNVIRMANLVRLMVTSNVARSYFLASKHGNLNYITTAWAARSQITELFVTSACFTEVGCNATTLNPGQPHVPRALSSQVLGSYIPSLYVTRVGGALCQTMMSF